MGERQPKSIIGQATWETARRLVHPEIEGIHNLEIIGAHLENGGTAIGYANHRLDLLGLRDLLEAGTAVEDHIKPSPHHAGVVVSRWHTDPRNGIFARIKHYFLIEKWPESPGIMMFPVVQDKDKDNVLYSADWREFNDNAYNQAEEFASLPGHMLLITPEGERGSELQEAEVGVAALFRKLRKTALAIPLALPYSESKVIAGTPYSWDELLEDHKRNPNIRTKDRMMVRLALLLSPQYRGFYAQMASEFVMPPESNS